MNLAENLKRFNACEEAVEWAGSRRVSRAAWRECDRGDWLLWLVASLGMDRRRIVLAACDCAEVAYPYAGDYLYVCVNAVEYARAWVRGEATREEVREASYAAYAAAYAAASAAYAAYGASYAAYGASYAAAYAAYAAYAATSAYAAAAAAVANVAYAAAYTAYAATSAYAAAAAAAVANVASAAAYDADAAYAAGNARAELLAECADIVRRHFMYTEVRDALGAYQHGRKSSK